jgi:tetratricopeptide (TPR) repeat protein
MNTLSFPASVPGRDIVSDYTPFNTPFEKDAWKRCHKEFVTEASNRTGILAAECEHNIVNANPALFINVVALAYSRIVSQAEAAEVIRKGLTYAVEGANQLKKNEVVYRHSEDDLNNWGYALLQQGKIKQSLQVFKLNVSLYPSNWNVYDSYGEALLKDGQKEESIKMYQKSVELNPNNDNGKKMLKQLSN